MTFKNIHLLVKLQGSFGSTSTGIVDQWSCGFRVGIPTSDIQLATPALQTFANAVHTAAGTMHGNTGMFAGSTCWVQKVTAARIGVDGKYNPQGQVTTVSTGAPVIGTGTPTQPWNAAHSIGLRTSAPRGYASNGRFYYPMIAASLASGTGRLTSAVVTGRLTALRTFFQAVNVAANTYDPGAVVCVMSNLGTGTTLPMIALRADERLDSIERRENNQPSNYVVLNM